MKTSEKKQSQPLVDEEEETDNLSDNTTPETDGESAASDSTPKEEEPQDWQARYEELNDTHLRLRAEYDNYRKRTIREKSELIRNGGEKAMIDLLPVIDDLELALKNIDEASDVDALKEGVQLIYTKFEEYLKRQGVTPIETDHLPFDENLCEAIAVIPVPSEEDKGMMIDCVKKGYKLNDKVIRHAHVVVGQ